MNDQHARHWGRDSEIAHHSKRDSFALNVASRNIPAQENVAKHGLLGSR
jgi:hypothetical protein